MEFWKMNGAGNDFIIIDNRSLEAGPDRLGRMARALCRRRFSIGADGLMAVEPAEQGGDFKMRFFNSDGSVGEMCATAPAASAGTAMSKVWPVRFSGSKRPPAWSSAPG